MSSMHTHDLPIVSNIKLISRIRCIPLPNSYRYWLGLGLGLGWVWVCILWFSNSN